MNQRSHGNLEISPKPYSGLISRQKQRRVGSAHQISETFQRQESVGEVHPTVRSDRIHAVFPAGLQVLSPDESGHYKRGWLGAKRSGAPESTVWAFAAPRPPATRRRSGLVLTDLCKQVTVRRPDQPGNEILDKAALTVQTRSAAFREHVAGSFCLAGESQGPQQTNKLHHRGTVE